MTVAVGAAGFAGAAGFGGLWWCLAVALADVIGAGFRRVLSAVGEAAS
ncbi:hypothetical protein JOF35_006926 [Streptomyces demainii]|uniref:Uncharacterized protein n=1 Tax=Streptomyces demainii TaxID=588122 RepID=A0ABT9L1M0_9ACTN|nr:hypothetical protein [Streptomyces demainii]